jgi:Zn-dependent oligopeptidase
MTFNWNPTEEELLKLCNNTINKISFVYKCSNTDRPYILCILRNENIIFSNEYSYFAFIHDITDKPNIKKICRKILNVLIMKKNSLYSNKTIYNNIKLLLNNSKDLVKEDMRFIGYMLDEFKKNGIKLETDIRNKVNDIKKDILILENGYNNNLEDEPIVLLNKDEILGLNENFLRTYESKDKYLIKMNEHTYNYLLENLEKTYVREKIQKLYFNQYKNNYNVLKSLIIKKDELSENLGYETYIDFVNSFQTLNSNKNINEFINQLNGMLNYQYKEDIYDICKHLNIPKIKNVYQINSWDLPYMINKYKNEKYHVDINVNDYFPVNETFDRVLKLFEQSFNIKFNKEMNMKSNMIWHPEVKLYNVSKNGETIGEIFFDLYNRETKTSGSTTITIKEPIINDTETQKAVVCVMTNFPVQERNNCFTMGEISILLHEILHALHIMLGKCKYTFLCSNNIEYSFIETFPQLMELWLNDEKVVKFLSCHYKTKAPLDDKNIQNIIKSNLLCRSIAIKYQILLSLLDNVIYNKEFIKLLKNEKKMNGKALNELYIKIFNSIFNTDTINIYVNPDNNPLLVFNHLASNYSGQYYGYIWSDHIANKLFKMIQNKEVNTNNLINAIIEANHHSPTCLLKKYFNINI